MIDVMGSPELYPIAFDREQHLAWFVPMSRDRYRNTSFLDPFTTKMGGDIFTFNLDDLLLSEYHLADRDIPIRYVFHTAFCCSTLLARCLDLVPACFVLREPSVLAQVAIQRPHPDLGRAEPYGDAPTAEWRALLNLAMRLLTRTFSQGDSVVIKVNDLCNALGDVLLEANPRSQILFLYVPLRVFILSVLKHRSRRTWLRARLRDTRKVARLFPSLFGTAIENLTDAAGAAYLWLLNSAIHDSLKIGQHQGRVLAFDGERLADSPRNAIEAICRFFELSLSEEGMDRLLSHPSVTRYSKDMSVSYDAQSRRKDIAEMESQYGEEVDEGVEWALTIKKELAFDSPWHP